jgi:DNA-binding MarR family transcriptional regulator
LFTNVQRLAAALGITKGAVSQTLRRLELKGLIRKGSDPRAGRHVIPILTDEGRRLHAKLRVRTGRFRRALVRDAEALGPAERDLLVRFLERTVERLRLLQAAPRRTSAGRRGGRSRSHAHRHPHWLGGDQPLPGRRERAASAFGQELPSFTQGDIDVEERVTRAELELWTGPLRNHLATAVDVVLAQAGGASPDAVFLTGGTSRIPSVRRLFAERFGEARLCETDAFTSVVAGLGRIAGMPPSR